MPPRLSCPVLDQVDPAEPDALHRFIVGSDATPGKLSRVEVRALTVSRGPQGPDGFLATLLAERTDALLDEALQRLSRAPCSGRWAVGSCVRHRKRSRDERAI